MLSEIIYIGSYIKSIHGSGRIKPAGAIFVFVYRPFPRTLFSNNPGCCLVMYIKPQNQWEVKGAFL